MVSKGRGTPPKTNYIQERYTQMKVYNLIAHHTADPNYAKFDRAYIDRDAAIAYASKPARCGFYIGEIIVQDQICEGLLTYRTAIVERIKFNAQGEQI